MIRGRSADFADNAKSDNEKNISKPIKTRIDYRGRVYIPVEIRKNLQLKLNDEINLKCEGNVIILSPVGKKPLLG